MNGPVMLDGPKIKADREALGLSIEEASALCGLPAKDLLGIEEGRRHYTILRGKFVSGEIAKAFREKSISNAARARLAEGVAESTPRVGAARPPIPVIHPRDDFDADIDAAVDKMGRR